jgi:hypothetical protein
MFVDAFVDKEFKKLCRKAIPGDAAVWDIIDNITDDKVVEIPTLDQLSKLIE